VIDWKRSVLVCALGALAMAGGTTSPAAPPALKLSVFENTVQVGTAHGPLAIVLESPEDAGRTGRMHALIYRAQAPERSVRLTCDGQAAREALSCRVGIPGAGEVRVTMSANRRDILGTPSWTGALEEFESSPLFRSIVEASTRIALDGSWRRKAGAAPIRKALNALAVAKESIDRLSSEAGAD